MTHSTYSQQVLSRYTLPRLKRIATDLGITPAGNKTQRQTWIDAIIAHQSTQLRKVDEQTLAQAELDHFITDQAEAIAPEALRTVEISFYDHEIYSGNEMIASITYDDDLTQPWVVKVEGVKKFGANTYARCYRFIQWHYKNSTLTEELPTTLDQTQAALPAQEQESCTTNEIMAQIFVECEKYGFEILDNGIYRDDQKLGEVGCNSGQWWFIRAAEGNRERVACESALEAVRWLSMVDVLQDAEADCEELLDRPFEMLTAGEWRQLREYEAVTESRELATV